MQHFSTFSFKLEIEAFDNNFASWDASLSAKDNIAKKKMMWGYMPGIATSAGSNYSNHLSGVPEKNMNRVVDAIDFVMKHCSKSSDASKLDITKDWETAYDMRPWCAFPERK